MQFYLTVAMLCMLFASAYAQNGTTTLSNGTATTGNASATGSPSPTSSNTFVDSNAAGQLSMSIFGLLVAGGVAMIRI
ncbi:hypothetical protein LTR17_023865 [Elasticomyces elasticus]|nr:hypothetical protein LTR17_023865 [Elasticomyces elasticus]